MLSVSWGIDSFDSTIIEDSHLESIGVLQSYSTLLESMQQSEGVVLSASFNREGSKLAVGRSNSSVEVNYKS